MLIYTVTIESTAKGIAMCGFKSRDDGDPAERQLAGILDCAMEAAQAFVLQKLHDIGNKGWALSGKDIETYLSKTLAAAGAFDLRAALKASGYKLPPNDKP